MYHKTPMITENTENQRVNTIPNDCYQCNIILKLLCCAPCYFFLFFCLFLRCLCNFIYFYYLRDKIRYISHTVLHEKVLGTPRCAALTGPLIHCADPYLWRHCSSWVDPDSSTYNALPMCITANTWQSPTLY